MAVELDLITGVLLVLAGFATAFINVMAGGGSAVSLMVLLPLLGPVEANATNRVAILFANILGTSNFARKKLVPWRMSSGLIVPALIGTGAGAWVATEVSPETIRTALGVVLIGVALSVLLKPSAWLSEQVEPRLGRWGRAAAFLAIGFYGGFIQVGVGFLLISGLVLGCGLDLVKGSAAKMFLIAVFTALAVLIFVWADQINWTVGLVMAIGNSIGAYLGTRLAMEKGARLIRWLLAIASVAVAIRMLFF
nr:TSUP family transporter [bacterium]